MKNTKFIFLIMLIVTVLVIISIAIYKIWTIQETTTQVEEPDNTLIEIESHLNYIIMYDKDTKVVYYRGKGGDADLCPLYNADGSLKIYSGGNNND